MSGKKDGKMRIRAFPVSNAVYVTIVTDVFKGSNGS